MSVYPASPKLKDYSFIEPTSDFKKVALSVIGSIVLFFLVYVLLIVIGGVLLAASGVAGFWLITARPGFITLALGGGLIALGVMFFAFLFKFIFSSNTNTNPHRKEITKEEHPDLFDFIKKLTEDTKTPFPKKVFVSPDVNAMVFYNSSFWSLFFPVRKNLEIGLGLVNTLNVSEFKSVLAHEFGHFSQRSMKLGSYIYTVNNVIYNLVFEYDKWDETLQGWANSGGIFGVFAGITFWLVEGVRGILKTAYNRININYLKLSRQMEYHADLVAVSVSGNEAFKNALRKIEFSSFAYEFTMGKLNALTLKDKASRNIYNDHQVSLQFIADMNDIVHTKDAFIISDKNLENSVIKSRVNIENQWASHPSLAEREQNIAQVKIDSEQNLDSAWSLFAQAETLKCQVTDQLYAVGFENKKFNFLNDGDYGRFVEDENNKYKIDQRYNGFYEGRFISEMDVEEVLERPLEKNQFENLYALENVEMIKRLEVNRQDLDLLLQIREREVNVKYFEYDNVQYKSREAARVFNLLNKEIKKSEESLKALDEKVLRFQYHLAQQNNAGDQLKTLYKKFLTHQIHFQSMNETLGKFQQIGNVLYSHAQFSEEDVLHLSGELLRVERRFKAFVAELDLEEVIKELEEERIQEVLNTYAQEEKMLTRAGHLDEKSFVSLSDLIFGVQGALDILYGLKLKEITDLQIEFQS